jgi:hypothetical protein
MVAGAAVACLAGLEVAVRLLVPAEAIFIAHGCYLADPELGVRLKPGFRGGPVSINTLGMRDREHARQKQPGARRILLLGDSFCFGVLHNTELRFANRLEARLATLFPGTDVLNSGCPTWGMVQQLRYLEREGLGFQPDLVLLAMFLGNDIVDNAGEPLYTALDGFTVPARWVERSSWLRLRLASWLHRLALVRWMRFRLAAAGDQPLRFLELFYRKELLEQNAKADALRLDQHRRQPREAKLLEAGWRRTFEALERMQEWTKDRGIDFAVLLIPDDLQLNPAWHQMLEQQGLKLEQFDFGQVNARLRGFLPRPGHLVLRPVARAVSGVSRGEAPVRRAWDSDRRALQRARRTDRGAGARAAPGTQRPAGRLGPDPGASEWP